MEIWPKIENDRGKEEMGTVRFWRREKVIPYHRSVTDDRTLWVLRQLGLPRREYLTVECSEHPTPAGCGVAALLRAHEQSVPPCLLKASGVPVYEPIFKDEPVARHAGCNRLTAARACVRLSSPTSSSDQLAPCVYNHDCTTI